MNSNTGLYEIARSVNPEAIRLMNQYLDKVMRTRGGRVGSGMGTVLETLWGYHLNLAMAEAGFSEFEIAWFPDHQYHDFACVRSNSDWDPFSKNGEFFRIEAKSMIFGDADEPKAHFDVLRHELEIDDAILLMVWNWERVDSYHVSPRIRDCYFDRATPIAFLRDELHKARGGMFVDRFHCPDHCLPSICPHHGEPLNADGKRERKGGPINTRVSDKTSHAQNFGGMLRMLKTSGPQATLTLRQLRRSDPTINGFVDFIYRNFPKEELNHYNQSEWQATASTFGLNANAPKQILQEELLRITGGSYRNYLAKF